MPDPGSRGQRGEGSDGSGRSEPADPARLAALDVLKAVRVDKAYAKGVLHGLPLGVKDMIDTANMVTGMGSPLFHGYRPLFDAASV